MNINTKISDILIKIQETMNIDVSQYSYTAQIVSSIVKSFPELYDSINEIINQSTIETKRGNSLDDFLNFFNISRLTNSSSVYVNFSFLYKGEGYLLLPKGTKFEYGGIVYEVSIDYSISKSSDLIKVICIATPYTLDTSFIQFGSLKIFTNGISIENTDSNKINYLINNMDFYGFDENSNQLESDMEYLERSKSIIQTMGMSNLSKITNTIKNIDGVYDCIPIEKTNYTDIFIIPIDYDTINDTMVKVKEIVDYYKSNNINIKKPFVISFNIENLLTQVPLDLQEFTTSSIKNYLKNLPINEYTINHDEIIKIVYDICYAQNKKYIFDEDILKIKYDIFSPNSYTVPICSNEIKKNRTKTFDNKNIFVLNTLK